MISFLDCLISYIHLVVYSKCFKAWTKALFANSILNFINFVITSYNFLLKYLAYFITRSEPWTQNKRMRIIRPVGDSIAQIKTIDSSDLSTEYGREKNWKECRWCTYETSRPFLVIIFPTPPSKGSVSSARVIQNRYSLTSTNHILSLKWRSFKGKKYSLHGFQDGITTNNSWTSPTGTNLYAFIICDRLFNSSWN